MSERKDEYPEWFELARQEVEVVAQWPDWKKAAMQVEEIPRREEPAPTRPE